MKELSDVKEQIKRQRPADWDNLPDIGLYMDQVTTYMTRQGSIFCIDGLTPAMVNNYIKFGLMPRADGKKYSRAHLAYLMEICILKQVLSVRDIALLLEEGTKNGDLRAFYEGFLESLDESLGTAADGIEEQWDIPRLAEEAVTTAVASCALKIVSERLLAIVREKRDAEASSGTGTNDSNIEKQRSKKRKGEK
ncbi:DUF1836 domain-containing protein [Papillibacter cinnamivorans]|uniref:DUF1836 domain-containing protein n=1 Tax=Papillibacter cinnamivorans DSM 12816 TaxID=1122930 RepID=A0A1W2A7Z6_9FIRM|nr:DUF1836 domain-containing protein [Papillibacter cinnamivorans]SMC56592.1 protein of unknown function [Papillibacter cinnamivorans DSM 12816]